MVTIFSGIFLILLASVSASKVFNHIRAWRSGRKFANSIGEAANTQVARYHASGVMAWAIPTLAGLYFGIRFILGI